jgi:hypothetical protein
VRRLFVTRPRRSGETIRALDYHSARGDRRLPNAFRPPYSQSRLRRPHSAEIRPTEAHRDHLNAPYWDQRGVSHYAPQIFLVRPTHRTWARALRARSLSMMSWSTEELKCSEQPHPCAAAILMGSDCACTSLQARTNRRRTPSRRENFTSRLFGEWMSRPVMHLQRGCDKAGPAEECLLEPLRAAISAIAARRRPTTRI